MQKRLFLSIILTFLMLSNAVGQIIIEEKPIEDKPEPKIIDKANRASDRDVDSVTRLYFNSNWSSTFRELKPNGDLFGEELGTRADETRANFWSFGFGLRNKLSKHFQLEVGLGVSRNGEKYNFEGQDTNFSYTTKYNYITTPIIAYYTYGEEIRFVAGAGIMPGLFMSEVQNQEWLTTKNAPGKKEIKTKGGSQAHATAVSSALFRIGVELMYSRFWSLYFIPEYRIQLSNTYSKTSDYIHKANAFGFNLGLTYQL